MGFWGSATRALPYGMAMAERSQSADEERAFRGSQAEESRRRFDIEQGWRGKQAARQEKFDTVAMEEHGWKRDNQELAKMQRDIQQRLVASGFDPDITAAEMSRFLEPKGKRVVPIPSTGEEISFQVLEKDPESGMWKPSASAKPIKYGSKDEYMASVMGIFGKPETYYNWFMEKKKADEQKRQFDVGAGFEGRRTAATEMNARAAASEVAMKGQERKPFDPADIAMQGETPGVITVGRDGKPIFSKIEGTPGTGAITAPNKKQPGEGKDPYQEQAKRFKAELEIVLRPFAKPGIPLFGSNGEETSEYTNALDAAQRLVIKAKNKDALSQLEQMKLQDARRAVSMASQQTSRVAAPYSDASTDPLGLR